MDTVAFGREWLTIEYASRCYFAILPTDAVPNKAAQFGLGVPTTLSFALNSDYDITDVEAGPIW